MSESQQNYAASASPNEREGCAKNVETATATLKYVCVWVDASICGLGWEIHVVSVGLGQG